MHSKSIGTEAVFTKTEMNNEWNINFFFEYMLCAKSIKIKVVFTKTELYDNWKIDFIQNISLCIQHTYFHQFSLGQNIFETSLLIWCETESSCCF